MVITIDGPAGVGKSTLAKYLSEKLGWLHLNSGLFYRLAGSFFDGDYSRMLDKVHQYFTIQDLNIVSELAQQTHLTTVEAGERASIVSSFLPLRDLINQKIRSIAQSVHLVAEGRDMSTVVFPDAFLKIYLDSDLEERARRRWLEQDRKENLETIKESLSLRDKRDIEKEHGALRQAPNSWYLDTTHLTIDQVCEKVLLKINSMMGQGDIDHVG